MKRGYTVEEFKELVAKLRKAIPEITIATDVIVAFPGETHDEFLETVQLLKDVKPPIVNISRYSDRPGTAAAQREDQISGDESKQRSSFVTQTFEYVAYEQNKKWQNWEGEVVVTQEGKDHSWVGRNYCYKPVILHGKFTLGDKVKVKVMYSTIYDLRADIMD